MYSEQVMDHFRSPRHLGTLSEARQARCVNPVCGDECQMFVRLAGERLEAVRFQAVGCVAALACCSRLCERVQGLSRDEALAVTPEQLLEDLGGLPRSKRHGAALAVATLREALGTVQ